MLKFWGKWKKGMKTLRVFRSTNSQRRQLPLPIVEDETQQVILNMLDRDEVSNESHIAIVKVLPIVEYDRDQIFK